MLLADRRPDVPPKQRNLIARLAQGAAGQALGFNLEAYTAARADALLLIRNADIRPELERLSQALSFHWIEQASRGLDQVYSGMRRNLLRSLSLDAFATQLTNASR